MKTEKENNPSASEKIEGAAKFMGFMIGALATCAVLGSFALGISNYLLFKKLEMIPHEGEIISKERNGYLIKFRFRD